MKHQIPNNKYITVDCNGHALQFTGSGRSIQCCDEQADLFDIENDAQAALDRAGENGGVVMMLD